MILFHISLRHFPGVKKFRTSVIGLALQETLGNFFAGISLQIEQPFRLGDVIEAGGVEGRVETFNWRATTVQTVSGSRVVIPNSVVAREAVEVLWQDERRICSSAKRGPPSTRKIGDPRIFSSSSTTTTHRPR